MKTIALASRLMRDLKEKSLADLTADTRLELVDAINFAGQKLHSLAPPHSKQVIASFSSPAPQTVSLGVTQGSTEITGYNFPESDFYRTIRIDGDAVDNQINGTNSLLHPYIGATGTVSAIIYGDAILVPSTIEEIVSDLHIIDTRTRVTQDFSKTIGSLDYGRNQAPQKRIGRPDRWWPEAKAENQNPPVPSIIRLNTLPDVAYRIQADATKAPLRVTFLDLLDNESEVALRDEHIEAYLIPIARGHLTKSSMWANQEEKAEARSEQKAAMTEYSILSPKTLSTPANRVGTPKGY
jgi:hypothetical protein